MDNKSDTPTVLSHTNIIYWYVLNPSYATIAYYVYFSFLAKYSPVYGSNMIIRSITVTAGQEGIWHLLHGEHHMKCQEVTNRMEDDLWSIQPESEAFFLVKLESGWYPSCI